MSEEYLWDRSGPADPGVEELEHALAPLRYRHRPELVQEARSRHPFGWAAAAAVVLVGIGLWQFQVVPAPLTQWEVSAVDGEALLGKNKAVTSSRVRARQIVRTGEASQITLQSDALGRIEIGPHSQVRADSNRQVSLSLGTLHAFIWAPPRQFVVDTPSARAVDLGCAYTISVNRSGDGLLRVETGWVAFQVAGKESFIPAGAECVMKHAVGPGVPYYEDAPAALRDGLAQIESGDRLALARVLSAARPQDGLTLWHLLTRTSDAERPAVFDRFAALVRLPDGLSRDAALRNDPTTIDLCWNALNLENTEWWRGWEREWK